MAEKTVTLYIDDTSLRLMVTQGKEIKEWAESPLEPGLLEDNVVLKEAEVTARIKQLFEAQKIKPGKVILGLSGLRCLTRPITLPRLPKEMLEEAVRREAQRALPVALEELYLSWQTIPSPAEQTQVFLVGIPRKMTDTLFKALQQAGLKPSFMEIKPLLIARVVKEQTAIIIDVQATEFDTVVLVDGIPRPVRSTRFASGALSSEEKLTTVKNELNRSLSFYNSNNPEKALAANIPIYTSGDLANESELYKPLSTELGHPVLPLPSPLECPEGFDPSHYMANIGLAFQKLPPGEKTGGAVVSLNALPAHYQTKPVSLTHVLPIPGAVVAAGLLTFLVIFVQSISADIASTNARLTSTNQQLQERQSQREELTGVISELQNKVSGMTASRDSLTAALGILEEQGTAINRDLAVAVENLPQSINMTGITHIASILTITGRAPREGQILSYITNLDKSGRFASIVITKMTRIENDRIDFTLVGTLQAPGIGASAIEVALASLPLTVSLTDVSSAEGSLTVKGTAPNADRIFSYLRALEASGKYAEITINSIKRTAEGGMNFSLLLKTGE